MTPPNDPNMPRHDPGSPVGSAELWRSLTTEPGTGVWLVTPEPRVLYWNAQGAKMYLGPNADPAAFLGRSLAEFMPPEWVRERREILAHLLTTGHPALLRSVWDGWQVLSWITPLHEPGDVASPRFLIISRRVSSVAEAEMLLPKDCERIDSRLMRLGPLNVLTPRELEVLALLGQGLSIKESAAILHRAESTVERHRDSIYEKLKIGDRVALGEIANRSGVTLGDAELRRI